MERLETVSLCPACLERIPARYVQEGNAVFMEKSCPQHGAFRNRVWRGLPQLADWLREPENTPPAFPHKRAYLGCPYDCGLCENHRQAACCIVFDVTNRCDLRCPICLADAGEDTEEPSLERIGELYSQLLADSPERPYNIQLSGGEPLLRQDIAEIIALGKAKGFPYIQLNTNGLRLAREERLAGELKAAGLDCVFLQFDGLAEEAYLSLRGEPLLAQKLQVIENCRQAGLGVVLVMTVMPRVNDRLIGGVVDFALASLPAIRGIHFLPVSYMGRNNRQPADDDHITLPELIGRLEVQSNYRLRREDFIPLISGHTMCSFHGNFILESDGGLLALSSEQDTACCTCKQDRITRARDYIAKKCSSWQERAESVEDWDLFIKDADARGFSITAMAFQDVWNIDLNRLQRCRLQAITKDGRLIPLCAYHLTSVNGERLYARC